MRFPRHPNAEHRASLLGPESRIPRCRNPGDPRTQFAVETALVHRTNDENKGAAYST